MREQIAVLDGLGSLVDAGWAGREYTPEPAGGANYEGGSNWHPFTPTLPSSEGLAGLGSLGMDAAGYAGQEYQPEAGGGANYGGGSSWHPYNPTLPSSEGLAGSLSIDRVPGWAGSTVVPEPGNGQNYTGGSDWFPGAPTRLPSEGLARVRGGLRGLGRIGDTAVRRWAACGVVNAMRIIRISRTSGDVEKTVASIMSLGFPRNVPLNAASIAYISAFYVARRVSVPEAAARDIARRCSAMCG